MKMNDIEKKVIHSNYKCIVETVEVDELLPYLYQEKVLPSQDCIERIRKSDPTRLGQTLCLMEKIMASDNPNTFTIFLESLKESYSFLAEQLERSKSKYKRQMQMKRSQNVFKSEDQAQTTHVITRDKNKESVSQYRHSRNSTIEISTEAGLPYTGKGKVYKDFQEASEQVFSAEGNNENTRVKEPDITVNTHITNGSISCLGDSMVLHSFLSTEETIVKDGIPQNAESVPFSNNESSLTEVKWQTTEKMLNNVIYEVDEVDGFNDISNKSSQNNENSVKAQGENTRQYKSGLNNSNQPQCQMIHNWPNSQNNETSAKAQGENTRQYKSGLNNLNQPQCQIKHNWPTKAPVLNKTESDSHNIQGNQHDSIEENSEEKTVTLSRKSKSDTFGFKFVSGHGRPRYYGDIDYYITEIIPGTPAYDAKDLNVQDTIQNVNNIAVRNMKYEDVISLFKQSLIVTVTANSNVNNS